MVQNFFRYFLLFTLITLILAAADPKEADKKETPKEEKQYVPDVQQPDDEEFEDDDEAEELAEQAEVKEETLVMPEEFKCDGCRAVAFQMFHTLKDVADDNDDNFNETLVREALEEACDEERYSYYITIDVGGVHMLNGPGIVKRVQMVISLVEGGRWPERLNLVCLNVMKTMKHEVLYQMHRQSQGGWRNFQSFVCEGSSSTYCHKSPTTPDGQKVDEKSDNVHSPQEKQEL